MLMPSDRHTPADLALWEELEAADRAHYVAGRVAEKARWARVAIHEFAAAGPCYVCVSGGKDSAVLAHLAGTVAGDLPVRWIATEPLIDPHGREAVEAVVRAAALTDYREHVNWCRRDDQGWHATGTFEDGIRTVQRETGCRRYILGVRADESGVRRISARQLGPVTSRSCRPLLWWSAADVFAYAAHHGLPLHPTYGMTGGGRWPRDRLRVAFLTLRHGDQFGRAEWEREYYGDVIRRLSAR